MEKMEKTESILIRHKLIIITFIIMLIIILMAATLNVHLLNISSRSEITLLNNWIKQHQFTFLLCHVLLLAAIYLYWGAKANRLAQKSQFFTENIKQIKCVCWALIGMICVIDIIVFLR